MEIRIGVTQSPKEIEVDMDDGVDSAALVKEIQAAVADGTKMLWLTDRRGRRVGVPAAKLAYVELGPVDGGHKVGFS